MLRAESDVGIGRKVKHDITAGHGTRERSKVERVALDEREAGIRNGAGEKPTEAGREVVESRDVVPVREEPIHEGAADEPGTAGDKCVHAGEIITHWTAGPAVATPAVTVGVQQEKTRSPRAECGEPESRAPSQGPIQWRLPRASETRTSNGVLASTATILNGPSGQRASVGTHCSRASARVARVVCRPDFRLSRASDNPRSPRYPATSM